MDVELDIAELTSEEQEELDRITKVEDGSLPIKEMPVRYYFKNNYNTFFYKKTPTSEAWT